MFVLDSYADRRFMQGPLFPAAITYPFRWLLGMHPTSEVPFRDARFALVAVFLPVALVVSALRPGRGPSGAAKTGSIVELRQFWLHGLFFIASYAIWLKQFGYQRYALPLELLTGLMLFLSLDRLLRNRKEVTCVFSVLAVFIVIWTRPANWGRIPYGNDWFGIEIPRDQEPPTLYVMMGHDEPFAYVIPFMPDTSQFIRLTGNMPLDPNMPLGRKALSMIRAHTGTIRSLGRELGEHIDMGPRKIGALRSSPHRRESMRTVPVTARYIYHVCSDKDITSRTSRTMNLSRHGYSPTFL
jgi:hypothetical protein